MHDNTTETRARNAIDNAYSCMCNSIDVAVILIDKENAAHATRKKKKKKKKKKALTGLDIERNRLAREGLDENLQ
jgi:hypothetical protein